MSVVEIVLGLVVAVCFGYLVLTSLVALAFVLVGAVENSARKLEDASADYSTLALSRFTVPVSVIVAAYNEERVIESTVRSLLSFDLSIIPPGAKRANPSSSNHSPPSPSSRTL